jgi:hypothetical protein
MFGILDHVTTIARTCYNSKLECTLLEFNAKQLIKLSVHIIDHVTKACYSLLWQLNSQMCITHNILMIIEIIVLVGRTYKHVLTITQPRLMSSSHINHFVNVELKGFTSAPKA